MDDRGLHVQQWPLDHWSLVAALELVASTLLLFKCRAIATSHGPRMSLGMGPEPGCPVRQPVLYNAETLVVCRSTLSDASAASAVPCAASDANAKKLSLLSATGSKDATNVAPGITTRNKKLLVTKGNSTSSKDAAM